MESSGRTPQKEKLIRVPGVFECRLGIFQRGWGELLVCSLFKIQKTKLINPRKNEKL